MSGLASTTVIAASPSVRANDIVPPWPQPRGSFKVVRTNAANTSRSTGSPRSTSTRTVRTSPAPGAGTAPGATSNSPPPAGGTVRRRIPACWSAAVGASGSGVVGVDGGAAVACAGRGCAEGTTNTAARVSVAPATTGMATPRPRAAEVIPTDRPAAGRPSTASAAAQANTTAPSAARETCRAGTP